MSIVSPLPVTPPLKPMLAKVITEFPDDDTFLYEPKWDGFRCIIFRNGDEIELTSRNERPFNRYFPELLDPLREQLPPRCVLDGEIVLPSATGLDFDALQQRIHPAESRVKRLANETPAAFVAFDLLALDETDLQPAPLRDRRRLMETALADVVPPLYMTPTTTSRAIGEDWFARFEGAGLDGVIAKSLDGHYEPNARRWFKLKPRRTADCVVAGFRWHKAGDGVGSMLLGLHDHEGRLHHVGVCTSFSVKRRGELIEELAPYRENALAGHPWREWAEAEAHTKQRLPGSQSRWSAGKSMVWEPIRPELVVEVVYDQLQGNRFRHSARFLNWRPDRDSASCSYDQLIVAPPRELAEIFAH